MYNRCVAYTVSDYSPRCRIKTRRSFLGISLVERYTRIECLGRSLLPKNGVVTFCRRIRPSCTNDRANLGEGASCSGCLYFLFLPFFSQTIGLVRQARIMHMHRQSCQVNSLKPQNALRRRQDLSQQKRKAVGW